MSEHSHRTQTTLWVFSPFIEVYLRFQIFLSPILQSCFFQAPDHPAKPLTTAHESGYSYTSGLSNTFLLLSKVNHQVSCSKFYPLRGLLWPLVSGISQKGAVVPPLSAFKRCMHIMPNHLYPKSASFLPLSSDGRELLMSLQVHDEREGSVAGEGTMDIWATFSCNHAFRACAGPTAYILLPFDDGVLQCTPSCMAWRVRWHLFHDE